MNATEFRSATLDELSNAPSSVFKVIDHFVTQSSLSKWNESAREVFNLIPESERASSFERIHYFVLPVFLWAVELATQSRAQKNPRPFFVGVCAPQGAGKTTLTSSLVRLAAERGLRAINISIDDFYLTRSEQVALANQYPSNPFLQNRGYPGTHDVQLGCEILNQLTSLATGQKLALPRYDKSAHEGAGDRANKTKWTELTGPIDIVFFEGWMLAFKSIGDTLGEKTFAQSQLRDQSSPEPETCLPGVNLQDANLHAIDERLAFYEPWRSTLDALVVIRPSETRFVVDWRIEAEEKMKSTGATGMSRDAIETYIRTFLPAYELYIPHLPAPGESWSQKVKHDRILSIEIGFDRRPVSSAD